MTFRIKAYHHVCARHVDLEGDDRRNVLSRLQQSVKVHSSLMEVVCLQQASALSTSVLFECFLGYYIFEAMHSMLLCKGSPISLHSLSFLTFLEIKKLSEEEILLHTGLGTRYMISQSFTFINKLIDKETEKVILSLCLNNNNTFFKALSECYEQCQTG